MSGVEYRLLYFFFSVLSGGPNILLLFNFGQGNLFGVCNMQKHKGYDFPEKMHGREI